MKKIQFKYICLSNITGTSPGHYWESDITGRSGYYYPAAEVDALVEFVEYLISNQPYKDFPLEHSHNEDARYHWPNRWKSIIDKAKKSIKPFVD